MWLHFTVAGDDHNKASLSAPRMFKASTKPDWQSTLQWWQSSITLVDKAIFAFTKECTPTQNSFDVASPWVADYTTNLCPSGSVC